MARRLTLAALAATFACALLAGLGSASVNVAQSGWSWGNPTPQGNTLNAIDFVQGRGYASGDAGTVLRTDDGGQTWTGLATGTSADLTRLQVLDPDTLTVLGGQGCVLRRSDDAGKTFHKIFIVAEQNCPQPVRAFTFVDRQTGYLLLADGSMLRTTDAGQTFSRQTAIPGTQASNAPAGREASDIAFTGPDVGIAFMRSPGGAYATTDGGVSWKPIDNFPWTVNRAWFMDAQTGFGVGGGTLVSTTDGGKTWKFVSDVGGRDITNIRCTDPKTCILTTSQGDRLLRTTDGGETFTEITPSSQSIFAAAFNSATRVAAVGASGATVLSDDGGVNFTPNSTDIGGEYQRLSPGPSPSMAFALGPRGALAATSDGGATWRTLGVPTSRTVVGVAFATADTGFALDETGALFKTANAGKTWQTLDTGTTSAPRGLAAPSPDVVVLAGPRGIRRGEGATQPQAVGNSTLRKATLSGVNAHSGLLVAWGSAEKHIFLSTDQGKTWKTIKLPKKVAVGFVPQAADFVSRKVGFFFDRGNRLFKTTNGGRTWTQQVAAATSDPIGISMADASNGIIPLLRFGPPVAGPAPEAYVLRTSDGGKTWRPQLLARGGLARAIATAPLQGYALIDKNHLFFTTSGGDAGSPTTLSLRTAKKKFTKKTLKKAKNRVTVSGTLPGAVGGEQIVVSRRDVSGSRWIHQTVTAGANGGSFTTSWKIGRSSVVVAQWAGDSGRRGAGSVPLTISVKG
jgi:photosystem II stability/assembly factor-like uncharacterized protein